MGSGKHTNWEQSNDMLFFVFSILVPLGELLYALLGVAEGAGRVEVRAELLLQEETADGVVVRQDNGREKQRQEERWKRFGQG